MRIFILLIFLLTSCSLFRDYEYRIDPKLQDIVDEFYKEAEDNGLKIPKDNLIIELSDIPGHGLCYCGSDQNVIKMNRAFVDKNINSNEADYNFVKLAVFHEMGHLIGYLHRGPQKSIMNSTPDFGSCDCGDFILTVRYYNESIENQNALIKEMFE